MNQKLTIFTHNTVIQDSLDDILIVFCVDGGWFWRDTPRKENGVIVMSTFKATGVDFGMYLIFVWQLERVVGGLWLGFGDLKWTNVARIELCTSTLLFDAET